MLKRIARWILRDEIGPEILPPAKVMMYLKQIFSGDGMEAGMAYAQALKITECYKKEYQNCIDTCADIRKDQM